MLFGGYAFYRTVDHIYEYRQGEVADKVKVVVLGSGFAALGFVSELNTKQYDVTVVSPRPYFLYTPLLPQAVVGAVDIESIVEPIRSFAERNRKVISYYEAKCTDVDFEQNKIICKVVQSDKVAFELPYDHLIVATGARNVTKGIKGVDENALFLDSLNDARRLRNRIMDNFEKASLPSTPKEEKERLLHFVIVGGSPTAGTLAAELVDFVNDKKAQYPALAEDAKVTHIPLRDHIHNFYDHAISKYYRLRSRRKDLNKLKGLIMGMDADSFTLVRPDGTREEFPYGTIIWATGKAASPFTKLLASKLPETQLNEFALITEPNLRLSGAKNVWALGDCSTISQSSLLAKWEKFFQDNDINKDGVIDRDEFRSLCQTMGKRYPALLEIADRADDLFSRGDTDKDNQLKADEFQALMSHLDHTLTRYPTTASTALQQGQFLAQQFNEETVKEPEQMPHFRYKHIGGYEYVGAEDGLVERGSKGAAIVNGWGAWWMWSNAYYSSMVGLPMRLRVVTSQLFTRIFGNDPTRY